MKRPDFKLLASLSLAILTMVMSLFSSSTVSAYGSTENFYFKDFTGDYYLTREDDGTSNLMVVEQFTAVFPSYDQNHGITRRIPFTNNGGKNLTIDTGSRLRIDVQRNGRDENVNKVEQADNYYTVYIGDADEYVHGEQVYTLTYEFTNVMLDFENWQELYWDTNGSGWAQRFNAVTARVHLTPELREKFTGDTSCYVGKYGENGASRCTTSKLDDGMEFSASKLSSYENLTFVMNFAANTFALPPQRFDFRLVVTTIILVLTGAVVIFLAVKSLRDTAEKRKYYKEKFVKPEYAPPADITVAEMASNYIGPGAMGDTKVATLLDLAVQHKIEIVKTEKPGMFGKTKTQWVIKIKTNTLNKQQAIVLKILAGDDTALHMDQELPLKSHTATTTLTNLSTQFLESVKKGLESKGLAEKGKQGTSGAKTKKINIVTKLIIATSVWFVGGVFLMIFAFDDLPTYKYVIGGEGLFDPNEQFGILHLIDIFWFIGVVIFGVAISIKCAKFASRTMKGLDYSKYMEGLRLYIQMAEADRLKMLQSVKGADTTHKGIVKLYEKLLPYAVIFRLEKSWLSELGKYYEMDDVAAPTWYVGVGAFSAREFSSAMASASSSMSSVITSSTSSSSSGSGGGGFSGGGGGGGGGGGW